MRIVKTRKDPYCDYCQDEIPKGSKAKVESEKRGRISGFGSYFTTYYYHMKCPMKPPYVL